MKIETWPQLMAVVKQRDILHASKGKLSQRQAHTWSHKGLPHFEHEGRSERHIWIVKAAKAKGIEITADEVLALSSAFKSIQERKNET